MTATSVDESPPRAESTEALPWRRISMAMLAVLALALLLRLPALDRPAEIVFDETYYAKDAWATLTTGAPREWRAGADDEVVTGDVSGMREDASFFSHPPGGLWTIAVGEWSLGMGPVGWRVAAAVAGSLAAAGMVLVGVLAFGAVRWGALAGTLVAVDGMAISMGRLALLDPLVMAWLVLALLGLCLDRRTRMSATHVRLWRPWRLVAGLALGLAAATKWTGLPVMAGLGLLTVGWQYRALWSTGVGTARAARLTLLRDAPVAFVTVVGAGLIAYLATWTSWLLTDDGYGRQWGSENPATGWSQAVPDAFRSLWHLHDTMYTLVSSISAQHPYASRPGGWLAQLNPVLMYSETASGGCSEASCVSQILALGTPVIWWTATVAFFACFGWWLGFGDWASGLAFVGIATVWMPWFFVADRPLFSMYMVAALPFVALAVVVLLRRAATSRRWPRLGVGLVVLFLLVLTWQTWYFYPLWTAQEMGLDAWRDRMWLPGWG